jgi:DNA-binding NtrC family response regulator
VVERSATPTHQVDRLAERHARIHIWSEQLGGHFREIAPDAMERLREYPWPGNIRELRSVLKQALLRWIGPVLVPAFLPDLPPCLPVESGTPIARGSPLEALIEHRLREGS